MRPKEVLGKRFMRICFANKVLWREFDYEIDLYDGDNYRKIIKDEPIVNDVHPVNYGKILSNIQKYTNQNYAP